MAWIGTPAAASWVAKVWRRVCQPIRRRRAAFQARRIAFRAWFDENGVLPSAAVLTPTPLPV